MKNMSVLLAVVIGGFSFVAGAAPSTNQPPNQSDQSEVVQVSQLELAKLVVDLAGLRRFLPANPSPADYFALLMANGIAPAGGWVADQPVTRYDLARVVVLTLKQGAKVQNPDDPQSWIDYLVGTGVRVDTIGLATKPLEPLALPLGATAFGVQQPGQRLPRLVTSGDVQLGAVMQPIRELFIVGPQPKPVTPTAPAKGARI